MPAYRHCNLEKPMNELTELVNDLTKAEEAAAFAKHLIREYLRTKADADEVAMYMSIDWSALRRDHRGRAKN